MSTDYAHAVVAAERFSLELEKLSMAEREHVLRTFLGNLPFCKHCGSSSLPCHCQNDE
jgi:hypothetical protein